MPEYFWKWYKKKGYAQILSEEQCFNNKAFLVGCCIEYLTEKGQRISNIGEYNKINDIANYLIKGVAWTS